MTFVPKDKIIDEEDEESDNSSDIMSILINELYEKPTIDKLLDVNKKWQLLWYNCRNLEQ